MKLFVSFGLLIILASFSACAIALTPTPDATTVQPQTTNSGALRIVAGSEIKTLEDAGVFSDFTKSTGIDVSLTYKGSVDIKNQVLAMAKNNPKTVDAFMAASAIWYPGNVVQNSISVMRTYIVMAVDPAVAKTLGWDTKPVQTKDVIAAIKSGQLNLIMCSASQCDSGATYYLAFLSGLRGGYGVVTKTDLQNPTVIEGVKTFLNSIGRGADSADTLEKILIEDRLSAKPKYNAAVMYESVLIDANQQLVAKGKAPLRAVYVQDAIAIADMPLGYVDNGDQTKLDAFNKLVAYLQSADVQKKVLALGWRSSTIGMKVENADTSVFNPAWGIDVNTEYMPFTYPKDNVVAEALDLYQSTFRKPSYTVFCLDFSGSMASNGGEAQVKDAMDLLLDQNRASEVSLQATSKDTYIVYTFNEQVSPSGTVNGNDANQLKALSNKVKKLSANGSTNMFGCVEDAIDQIAKSFQPNAYNYAVIVLTDGQSNRGPSASDFANYYRKKNLAIPVFGITFGDADTSQLGVLVTATNGAVYDGKSNMIDAFRKAKGNN